MKLFVDDIREAPDDSWTVARNVTQAIRILSRFQEHQIEAISLDHDSSHGLDGEYELACPEDFSAVAYFIGEKAYNSMENFGDVDITIHSANPVGAENIKKILEDYGIFPEIKAYVPPKT